MNNKRILVSAFIVFAAAFLAAGKFTGIVFDKETDAALYKIAVTDDSAGLLILYAAEKYEGADVLRPSGVSFLQLTDCCGTQAEFALSAGEFDMAILCPDAASAFVESEPEFAIIGDIVKRSNVIMCKDERKLQKIGYTNGKNTQAKAAFYSLGNADIKTVPMMRTALAYALERDAVDGIVVDVSDAIKSSGIFSNIKFLDYSEPTSVLVAKKQIAEAKEFDEFLKVLNTCVQELNEGLTEAELTRYFQIEPNKGVMDIWKKSRVTYINIPNAE